MRVLITGSSGLVGAALISYLVKNGHEVIRLVRNQSDVSNNAIFWSPNNEKFNSDHRLENLDAVVNLAGDNIATGRWTLNKKKKILESRVYATKTLCKMLLTLKKPPSVLVNASAIGFYGDRGEEELNEESQHGDNFLSSVCKAWESSTQSLKYSSIRVVYLRLGAVLAKQGGALAKMITPFKLGFGAVIGSGKQYFSFISMDDLVRAILFVIQNKSLTGPVNAVTPHPITNREFTKTLGLVLQRPTFFKIPEFAVSLLLGQMADELLLASAKVYPRKLLEAGFYFNYSTIKTSLQHVLELNKELNKASS